VVFTALDARKLGFRVFLIDDACRGIDIGGSIGKAYKEMAAAGVIITNSVAILSGHR
jgi:nicotinamidase/pyrazinamidase